MKLAHNIGIEKHPNYNTREQILACQDEIGFDGIYKNVYENQDVLEGKSGIFFVMGDYLGKDNSFDLQNVPKLEQYCTLEEIKEMADKYNFKLGWHTWSHPDLTTLSDEEIRRELSCPKIFGEYLAYPYGRYDERVVRIAKEMGFKDAWSVTQGTDEPFKRFRNYI